MAASQPVTLKKSSQNAFLAYYESLQNSGNTNRSTDRSRYSQLDKAYMRELNRTQENTDAKRANALGDADRFQDVTVPIVKTQADTAAEYQASVFLTGEPLFGVVSTPQYIDQALQMETVIEEQAIRGGWVRELALFFKDGFKYNFSALEVDWTNEVTMAVETNLSISLSQGIPKEVIWSGNRVRRLDVYNTFVDKKVPPTEVYKRGDFAGFTEYMSRIELKSYIASLPEHIVANVKPAFESPSTGMSGSSSSDSKHFYIPDINPDITDQDNIGNGTNWLKWAGLSSTRNANIEYKDAYEVTTLYCRVLPSEFDLRVPNSNTPQIYKLIIVNHSVILYAERQTNAHNYIPILIGQPSEDGLRYQTKSLANDALPFQFLSSAHLNAITASRRRAISDRVIYDPSRITSAIINSPNPSAKMPVKPSAYGKPVQDAVYAFPYREDQQTAGVQQIQMLVGLANNLAGQNQASQGQFVKGNKTLHEFESVMSNANSKDQVTALLYESQIFTAMKLILKLNILQYQAGTTLYNRNQQRDVKVDPVALRKAVLEFRITDGLIPSSKVISGDAFGTALQALGNYPQLSQGYNIAPMFSYLVKTQGADLSPFEKSSEQVAYEQAVGQWQQMVALAIEKDQDPAAIGPQPLPEQFGYDPTANTPSPKAANEPTSAGTQQTAQLTPPAPQQAAPT